MADEFKRIRSAVTDGRAQSPRYIQKQLTRLYDTLRKNQKVIHRAIRRDNEYSSAEADAEIYMALQALRQEYETFDFAKVLEQEYSLAHNKENLSKRVAVGCVYIVPCQHSRFYSIIQPICAAIAAGNCIVIEIEQTISEVDPLLRNILAEAMDKDTFAVVERKPSQQDFFMQSCVVVDGRSGQITHEAHSVINAPSSRTVAVVDRTSNIDGAARELVRARFSFRGSSSYSPDVVLVNEFILSEFCSAAARYATNHIGPNIADAKTEASQRKGNTDLQNEVQKSGAITLVSGSRGSIILLQERDSSLLTTKIPEPILLVHPIKSLDDAIDVANSASCPLLATYLFAASTAAKYLSQFISSRASFANYIPIELLIGPAAPLGYTTSPSARYNKEMFSSARPEYITPSTQHTLLRQILDESEKSAQSKMAAELATPLPPMNEPAGKAIGFFEQGLMTGGGVVVVCAVAGLTVMVKYVGPAVLRRFR